MSRTANALGIVRYDSSGNSWQGINELSEKFERVWDSDALCNAELRIDQTIEHFINVKDSSFYHDRDELICEIKRFLTAARKRSLPPKLRNRIGRKLGKLVKISQRWSKETKADQVEIDAMSYWAQQSDFFYDEYSSLVRDLQKALSDAKDA